MKAEQINRFVGLPYEAGRFDCADLAALVQRELYGREVVLPGHRPQGAMTGAAAIRRHAVALADRVSADQARDGDAVLIRCGERSMHIGTLFTVAGARRVLHNSSSLGHSVLHRLSDLPAYGLIVEGFYRWK